VVTDVLEMASMDPQVQMLRKAMEMCIKSVPAAVGLEMGEKVNDGGAAVNGLRKTIMSYATLEAKYMAVTSNIANSRAKYSELNEDARESLGAKGMDEIYKKVAKKEEKRKQEPQNNAIVKEFEREVLAERKRLGGDGGGDGEVSGDEEDEDLVMTQTTGTLLDPITRQPMRDPVKNIKCGHSYERGSIKALTKNGKKEVRCPIPGCPNSAFVEMDHLVDDTNLKRQIDRKNKKSKQK